MTTYTKNQIEQIRAIKPDCFRKIHGNTKKIGDLPVSIYKEIMRKKYNRFSRNYVTRDGKVIYEYKFKKIEKSPASICRELINWSLQCRGTNYYKIMIEGATSIYYASPIYGHLDYNKKRLFEKNENTLKLMDLVNSFLGKNNLKNK